MAKNKILEGLAWQQSVACSNPTTAVSGFPVRYGSQTGVALTNMGVGGNAATYTTVDLGPGMWDLIVRAVNDQGASAVALGDALYYTDGDVSSAFSTTSEPYLSKKISGYFFGFAGEIISSGYDRINVFHAPSPGSGTLGALGVATSMLAANAVTAPKLSATLATGFLPLDIADARIIGTNEIASVVGAATDPILSRNNTATDIAGRLSWASASVIEVQFPPICIPPDLDATAVVTFNLLARMKAGSVNTPVFAVKAFLNEGDTNFGGNTASLSTTLAKVGVTLAAADVGAVPYPAVINLSITPGAHATASNDVYVFGAWLEYTRK